MRTRAFIAAAALTSSLLGGLAHAESSAPAPMSDDAATATEIERRFSDDHTVNAQSVTIYVRDGVATLTGRVPNEDAKERAEKIANAVDGVDEVRNRLITGSGRPATKPAPGSIPELMPNAR